MLTGSSVTYVAQTKDQQHMVRVENPFSIAVENRRSASLSGKPRQQAVAMRVIQS